MTMHVQPSKRQSTDIWTLCCSIPHHLVFCHKNLSVFISSSCDRKWEWKEVGKGHFLMFLTFVFYFTVSFTELSKFCWRFSSYSNICECVPSECEETFKIIWSLIGFCMPLLAVVDLIYIYGIPLIGAPAVALSTNIRFVNFSLNILLPYMTTSQRPLSKYLTWVFLFTIWRVSN